MKSYLGRISEHAKAVDDARYDFEIAVVEALSAGVNLLEIEEACAPFDREITYLVKNTYQKWSAGFRF